MIRSADITTKPAGVALAVLVSLGTAAATVPSAAAPAAAPATTSATDEGSGGDMTSTIKLRRTIRTTPFHGSTVSMKDNEGSVYVARDHSLWLSDDEGKRLYELDATTGALKRMVTAKRLASVQRFRGSKTAGRARTRDLEGLAYDAATDRLYAFVGSDCRPSTTNCLWKSLPTAYRLTRKGGQLRPQSYQPLPARSQVAAATWHRVSGNVYVGDGHEVRTYDYRSNTFGPPTELPGPKILGMAFNRYGRALFVTHGDTRLSRITWRTRSLAWTVDLSKLGVLDARGVSQTGRRLFIPDGYDRRPDDSPLRYAVFVVRFGR
ncbi:MAG TPA: esterase-like activity of phytase family protein [Nocardioidaceae bacterium]|nr:esterase-like activity of phytase family protein [Nocardioidaceae bacterium]